MRSCERRRNSNQLSSAAGGSRHPAAGANRARGAPKRERGAATSRPMPAMRRVHGSHGVGHDISILENSSGRRTERSVRRCNVSGAVGAKKGCLQCSPNPGVVAHKPGDGCTCLRSPCCQHVTAAMVCLGPMVHQFISSLPGSCNRAWCLGANVRPYPCST